MSVLSAVFSFSVLRFPVYIRCASKRRTAKGGSHRQSRKNVSSGETVLIFRSTLRMVSTIQLYCVLIAFQLTLAKIDVVKSKDNVDSMMSKNLVVLTNHRNETMEVLIQEANGRTALQKKGDTTKHAVFRKPVERIATQHLSDLRKKSNPEDTAATSLLSKPIRNKTATGWSPLYTPQERNKTHTYIVEYKKRPTEIYRHPSNGNFAVPAFVLPTVAPFGLPVPNRKFILSTTPRSSLQLASYSDQYQQYSRPQPAQGYSRRKFFSGRHWHLLLIRLLHISCF